MRRLFIVESLCFLGKRDEQKLEEFKFNGIVKIFKKYSQTTLDKSVSQIHCNYFLVGFCGQELD